MSEKLIAVHKPKAYKSNCGEIRLLLITTDIDNGNLGQDWPDYCVLAGLEIEGFQNGRRQKCSHHLLALEWPETECGAAR